MWKLFFKNATYGLHSFDAFRLIGTCGWRWPSNVMSEPGRIFGLVIQTGHCHGVLMAGGDCVDVDGWMVGWWNGYCELCDRLTVDGSCSILRAVLNGTCGLDLLVSTDGL